jgi:hypothetical protein
VVYGLVIDRDLDDDEVIYAGCEIPPNPPRAVCLPCAEAIGLR